jgi:azurin
MNKSYLPLLIITLISGSFMYNHLVSAKDEKVDVTVEFNGTDTMMFSKTAFEVKSGQKVKLVFKNTGKLPKVAMGHNVVILKKGVNVATFCTEAIKFAPEYFPKTKKDDVIAATKLLGPDETDTVIFTAPAAGVYDYVCTFPGHFALMKGKMTVK